MALQPLELEALPPNSLIAIDSAPLIHWLVEHPRWGGAYAGLFEGIAEGRWRGQISAVTLAEVLTGPLAQGREQLAERYEAILGDPANLALVSLTPAIAMGAARLRARYRLRLPDAIQLATALHGGAVALVSHDNDYAGCSDLPVLTACS